MHRSLLSRLYLSLHCGRAASLFVDRPPVAASQELRKRFLDTETRLPYHMVAMERQGNFVPTASTPLLATSAIPSAQLFKVAKWRVRDGRTLAFEACWRDLRALLAAFGITEAQLTEEPPEPFDKASSIVTRQGDEEKAVEAARAQEQQIDLWHSINTAIYWHALPALVLTGVHQPADERLVASYVNGQRAHGRALIRWALQHADMSGQEKQAELVLRIAGSRVRPEATLAQL